MTTTTPAVGHRYFLVRPRHWDHMPFPARQKWERRHQEALRALRAETSTGADPSWIPPGDLVDEPTYDDSGRRVWSPEQMRAAVRAERRFRSGGTAMTPDEIDALNAHRRIKYRRRADAATLRADAARRADP